MGTHVIKVPDIGEGIAEVELVEWHVKPGDSVIEEQILADVMTDKASVEIPSPVAGKVLAITGKPGDNIAVGSELIRLDVEGAGNVRGDAAETKVDSSQSKSATAPAHAATAVAREAAPQKAVEPPPRST